MSSIIILHLEDNHFDADLIRLKLIKEGLDVQIRRVDRQSDFLEALQARRHDLILADYSLPGFDGLLALEIARLEAPDTPFLFVSGVIREDLAIESLKLGATDYVLKHRLDRLGPAVRRALTEARERADRRKAEAALVESDRLHRMTLDSVRNYAILTMDVDGQITSSNQGAEQVLGYRENEMVGQSISIIFTAEDARDGVHRLEIEQARIGGAGDDERWHVRKDRSLFWGTGLVTPLLDEAGQIRGFTKVVRDITERMRAVEALKEADRRKDEFLAMLAHELRNPLSAIQNAAQLAMLPNLPGDRLQWTREVISNQVQHLTHLVNDLLDVSRITRGKIRLRLDTIDLRAILNRVVETTRSAMDENRHQLILAIEPEPLLVKGDSTRLEQVFGNLLANAVKYTEAGGLITLTAYRESSRYVVVEVQDNGIGIDEQMLPRIFDLFAQVDHSLDRSQGGLGIGLTIARTLVQLHNGTIATQSEGTGRGSVFTVRLPATNPLTEIPRARLAPARVVQPGSRILIVDDNRDTAGALASLLRVSGFEVQTVHDGREAIPAARLHRPQSILLDIGLPGMDGYQVAENLRRDEDLKATILIAVTGYGQEQALRRSHEAGFNHHLVKPVNYDALLELLTLDKTQSPEPNHSQGHD